MLSFEKQRRRLYPGGVLGAGFDTRAIPGYWGKRPNTTVFELDARFTQTGQTGLYRKIHTNTTGCQFISIDFNEESLAPKLA